MEYKGFLREDNQGELRDRVIKCMKRDPKTFKVFCHDIGISYVTLQRFLNGLNVKFLTRCKLEAWCDRIEKIEY